MAINTRYGTPLTTIPNQPTQQTNVVDNSNTEKIGRYGTPINITTPAVSNLGTPEKKENILSSIFRGITEPVVTMATRPLQAVESVSSISKINELQKSGEELSKKSNEAYNLLKEAREEKDPIKKTELKAKAISIYKDAMNLVDKTAETAKEASPDLNVELPFYGEIKAPETGKDIVKDVGRGLETVSLGIGGGAVKGGITGIAKQGLKETVEKSAISGAIGGTVFGTGAGVEQEGTLEEALKQGLIGGALGGIGGAVLPLATKGIGKAIQKAPEIIKAPFKNQSLDEIVGKITQGTKQEVAKAKKALEVINTKEIKTYADLKKKTTDTISQLSQKQDEILGKNKKNYKLSELATPIKVGNRTVKQNYVNLAVGQLKNLYKTTVDMENLSRIVQLERKMNQLGLTSLEVNNLAREYGTKFASQAFDKMGQPLTSVNKIAFENTRKGLKNVSRGLMSNKASESIDDTLSNLFTLERTSRKMEESVQKLTNKIKERGLFERLGKYAGLVIDRLTGGTIRGFMTSFIPSNVGNKVMNALDLERELVKNLGKINKLLKSGTDNQLKQFIDEIIKKSGIESELKSMPIKTKKSNFGK